LANQSAGAAPGKFRAGPNPFSQGKEISVRGEKQRSESGIPVTRARPAVSGRGDLAHPQLGRKEFPGAGPGSGANRHLPSYRSMNPGKKLLYGG
jgi:hypothetical protein